MKVSPVSIFNKINLAMLTLLKPLGIWGIGVLAIIDSASIPVPIDALVIDYVVHDHAKFALYCLMAAVGSGIGSMVPYYVGRAGGELFLLKRVNRQRYEELRDRFEKQEFLAIIIPAMMPPPMPIKLVEFAAGVFEMKPAWFFTAIVVGKFIRFMTWSLLAIFYGPALLRTINTALQRHLGIVLGVLAVVVFLLVVYIIRNVFGSRRGANFPAEDSQQASTDLDAE